jgi:chromosome partitioning protein
MLVYMPACKLVAVVNSKGGVGKSTIAVHFAVAEAEKGKKVALIDSDVQESSTRWLRDLNDGVALYRLQTPDDVLEEAPKLVKQYDLVIADGPAGLSEVTRAILLVADLALLPCGPSTMDLRPARDSMRVVKQAQSIRQGIPRTYFVPNKLQTNTRLSRELLATAEALGLPVLPGLHLRQAYADAAGQGTVVWRMSNARAAAEEIHRLFVSITHETTNPI